MNELIQIGGGVALGVAALRVAEKGIALAYEAYKKSNGKPATIFDEVGKSTNEKILTELRTMNSNLEKHATKLDNVYETAKWLKLREQWKSENSKGV